MEDIDWTNILSNVNDFTGSEEQKQIVSSKYQKESNAIQLNIDDENLLNEIISDLEINEEITSDDWDEYKKWLNEEAIHDHNVKGEITGISDCYRNIVDWLEHYPPFKNKIRRNAKTLQLELNDKIIEPSEEHKIMGVLTKHFIPKFSSIKRLEDGLFGCGVNHEYNPINEYFNKLQYDGSKNWIRYCIEEVLNCPEKENYDLYETELTKMMIAFYKRNLPQYKNRNVKFDQILVLASESGGSGKSSFFEKLFTFNNINYCETIGPQSIDFKDKDFLMGMHQSAIANFDEVAVKRNIVNALKTFFQQEKDNFREPYAPKNTDHYRNFVIGGTTNNIDFLKDYTTDYERRWWIIHITEDKDNGVKLNNIFDDKNINLADKMWGQVMHLYNENPNMHLWLDDKNLVQKLTDLQRNYKASNNADYNNIVKLLEIDFGFYDKNNVDEESIIRQYRYGNCREWCEKHNIEYNEKQRDGRLTPEDRKITYFGKISKINANTLYNIISKLGFDYTKTTLKCELNKAKWADKVMKTNNHSFRGFEKQRNNELENFDSKNIRREDYDNINERTNEDESLPF